jgi:hypothetical protein
MLRRIGNVRFEYLVNPREHNPFIHPGTVLATVVVGCRVCAELCPRNPTIRFPLKDNRRWEYRTISGNRHCHRRTLRVAC